MTSDITPLIPEGRKVIEAYGDGGFKVTLERIKGSMIIFPEQAIAWKVSCFEEITLESFQSIVDAHDMVDVLLIGCGQQQQFLAPDLERALRQKGIVPEVMDTGAACRTYNVLLSEERRAAAALIAV